MAAIRLMTFNVQMLPYLAAKIETPALTASDHKAHIRDRARAVVDGIRSLPVRETPHVIAFNEVFSEDGRAALIAGLKTTWPHIIRKLDGAILTEDSGLMLFSQIPFKTLKNGTDHRFQVYSDSDDDDALAAKGVCLVRIDRPADPTTIVFTHLQASYDDENSEYRDTRTKQFAEIVRVIEQEVPARSTEWWNVVLVGDLNVKGDPETTTDEYTQVFESPSEEFGKKLLDGWNVFMGPPGATRAFDPGFTQLAVEDGKQNRFDYCCVSAKIDGLLGLVPHHLSIPLREQSDHFSLLAVLNPFRPFCTPSTAHDFFKDPPLAGGVTTSAAWAQEFEFVNAGDYQWSYLAEGVTFSLFTNVEAQVDCFLVDDLTHPLSSVGTFRIDEIPGLSAGSGGGWLASRPGAVTGQTFATHRPCFVRLRGKDESFTGKVTLGVVRHFGDCPATAIHLLPNAPSVPLPFPAGTMLGSDDRCWMKALIPDKIDAMPYANEFRVNNPRHGRLSCRLTTAF